MGATNYRDLLAWQRAMDLVEGVYNVSKCWPPTETYGLVNQIRRAAVSIPSNVAEGQDRTSDREFLQFLSVAHGSLREVETQLLISKRLGYTTQHDVETLIEQAAEVGRLMQGLIRRLRRELDD
jgi:four helix bundle protein